MDARPPSPRTEPSNVDWRGAGQRLVLIAILLAAAVFLVVGTQNYDERTRVHFLLWSVETSLLVFFLASAALGALAGEIIRLAVRLGRRPPPGAGGDSRG